MREPLLTSQQREILRAIVNDPESIETNKRARILLGYDDGLSNEQIAAQVGLSARSVRYWRQSFQQHGMDIFQTNKEKSTGEPPKDEQPSKDIPKNKKPKHDTAETLSHKPPSNHTKKTISTGIEVDDSMQQAGIKVIQYCNNQIIANEEGTRNGEDLESLHDMRVATRRLRAALTIFTPYFPPKSIKRLQKGMKSCGRSLGCVRDLDVFMEKARKDLLNIKELTTAEHQPLIDMWSDDHTQARKDLLTYLDSDEYQLFLQQVSLILESPITLTKKKSDDLNQPKHQRVIECVPLLLYQRFTDVRLFAPLIEKASYEQMHDLRRAFKMFRYTVEFFQEVLGTGAKVIIEECKKIQDHLGDLNDAHNACIIIERYKKTYEEKQKEILLNERQNPLIFLSYLTMKEQQRHELLSSFTDVWQMFYTSSIKQNLALAIAEI